MRRAIQSTAVVLGFVLLQVPASAGCSGAAGMMAKDCHMIETMPEPMADDCPMGAMMPSTAHADEPSPGGSCPECGGAAGDCCSVKPLPDPVETGAAVGGQWIASAAVTELPVIASVSSSWHPPSPLPPEPSGLPERFPQFSALLL